jgi:hypothetical protein
MNKNLKGIIAVAGTLGLIGAVYYFMIYRNTPKGQANKNFNDLQDNLGKGLGIVTKDTAMYDFNNNKNQATFFNNNRFSITTKGISGGYLKKGTYLNGGKKLIIDEGDTIEGNSVYANLLKAIQ